METNWIAESYIDNDPHLGIERAKEGPGVLVQQASYIDNDPHLGIERLLFLHLLGNRPLRYIDNDPHLGIESRNNVAIPYINIHVTLIMTHTWGLKDIFWLLVRSLCFCYIDNDPHLGIESFTPSYHPTFLAICYIDNDPHLGIERKSRKRAFNTLAFVTLIMTHTWGLKAIQSSF